MQNRGLDLLGKKSEPCAMLLPDLCWANQILQDEYSPSLTAWNPWKHTPVSWAAAGRFSIPLVGPWSVFPLVCWRIAIRLSAAGAIFQSSLHWMRNSLLGRSVAKYFTLMSNLVSYSPNPAEVFSTTRSALLSGSMKYSLDKNGQMAVLLLWFSFPFSCNYLVPVSYTHLTLPTILLV